MILIKDNLHVVSWFLIKNEFKNIWECMNDKEGLNWKTGAVVHWINVKFNTNNCCYMEMWISLNYSLGFPIATRFLTSYAIYLLVIKNSQIHKFEIFFLDIDCVFTENNFVERTLTWCRRIPNVYKLLQK